MGNQKELLVRINKLRELIDADKPSFGMNVTVDSPDVVEIIGKTGLVDYIEFEAEYMPYSLHSLDNLARATELYGMTSMIKIDKENQGFRLENYDLERFLESVVVKTCSNDFSLHQSIDQDNINENKIFIFPTIIFALRARSIYSENTPILSQLRLRTFLCKSFSKTAARLVKNVE